MWCQYGHVSDFNSELRVKIKLIFVSEEPGVALAALFSPITALLGGIPLPLVLLVLAVLYAALCPAIATLLPIVLPFILPALISAIWPKSH